MTKRFRDIWPLFLFGGLVTACCLVVVGFIGWVLWDDSNRPQKEISGDLQLPTYSISGDLSSVYFTEPMGGRSVLRVFGRTTQKLEPLKTPFAYVRALGKSKVSGDLLIAAGIGEAHGLKLYWIDDQSNITDFQPNLGYKTTPFASISPDGSRIAVLGSATSGRRRQPYDWFDFGILILGPKIGQETWTDAGGRVGGSKPRWSRDGRLLVCVENSGPRETTIAVIDTTSGKVLKRSPMEDAHDASFDSTGNIVVTHDRALSTLLTPGLVPIKALPLNMYQPECSFEPDTISYLFINSGGEHTVRILNTKTLVERDLVKDLQSKH